VRDSRGTPVELVVRLPGLGGGHPDWAVVWLVSFESELSEDRMVPGACCGARLPGEELIQLGDQESDTGVMSQRQEGSMVDRVSGGETSETEWRLNILALFLHLIPPSYVS
jgi:hypothetical protein